MEKAQILRAHSHPSVEKMVLQSFRQLEMKEHPHVYSYLKISEQLSIYEGSGGAVDLTVSQRSR